MKKFLILVLLSLPMAGGCQMFAVPLGLFQELLPIAIKYAPYALMFVEAPAEQQTREANPESTNVDNLCALHTAMWLGLQDPAKLKPLAPTLLKIVQGNKRLLAVMAVDLCAPQSRQRLKALVTALQKTGKVHYMVVSARNLTKQQNYQQVVQLLAQRQITFHATGRLAACQALSSGKFPQIASRFSQTWQQWLQTHNTLQ